MLQKLVNWILQPKPINPYVTYAWRNGGLIERRRGEFSFEDFPQADKLVIYDMEKGHITVLKQTIIDIS